MLKIPYTYLPCKVYNKRYNEDPGGSYKTYKNDLQKWLVF